MTEKVKDSFNTNRPQAKKLTKTTWQTSCCNSSPSNMPNFPHKHLYLTSTTPTNYRRFSCSKGVLEIYYNTVWYNLHTYSKSHNESLRPPVCTGTDRDGQSHHIFPVLRKQPLDRNEWYDSSKIIYNLYILINVWGYAQQEPFLACSPIPPNSTGWTLRGGGSPHHSLDDLVTVRPWFLIGVLSSIFWPSIFSTKRVACRSMAFSLHCL